MERSNGAVIYLSTDAAESETSLLQSLVVVDGKIVPLVKRPPRNSAEKWDALLYRHGIEDDSQVRILSLDKSHENLFDFPGFAFGCSSTEKKKSFRIYEFCRRIEILNTCILNYY